jgi:DNA-directed RNA polymerase specialized sigma24 family protein
MPEGYSLGKIAKKVDLPIGAIRSRYRFGKAAHEPENEKIRRCAVIQNSISGV